MNLKTLFVKYIKLRNKLDKAKIYKIVDNTNDNKYIGSTCCSLKRRLSYHKKDYKRFLKGLCSNVKSFEIIKNDNYKIELLEDCDIKTKQELLTRERFYIENNNCLNKCIPVRTKKEYYDYQKEYYNDNKDKINIKKNEKFECDCGGRYSYTHKSTHIKTNKHQNYLQSQNK